jgi:zinc finger SWIM domain-containing protein 3
MKSSFRNFPEVILVDATYKTNNMRMPLYFILSVDGNGQSEIVALFLLTQEEEILLSSVIKLFKNHNSSWKDVKVILTDKDMSERNVLGKAMTQANLHL